jgi:hypothetical protein
MASRPRSVTFSQETTRTVYPADIRTQPLSNKRQKMSLTQAYVVAHTARSKLVREASRSEHRLRFLVGHANLLDSLMGELAEAEREQEQWFEATVNGAVKASAGGSKLVEHADVVVAELDAESEESDDSDDGDDDDDDDNDDVKVIEVGMSAAQRPLLRSDRRREQQLRLQRQSAPPPSVTVVSIDSNEAEEEEEEEEEVEYEDDEADFGDLALVRTTSRPLPPDLLSDSDDDSDDDDDDGMPPSPPQPVLHDFSDAQRKAISTTSYYDQLEPIVSSSAPSSPQSARTTTTHTVAAAIPTADEPPLFNDDYFLSRRPQAC